MATHTIMLIPTSQETELKTTAKNLVTLLTEQNFRAAILPTLDLSWIESSLAANHQEELLEEITKQREELAPNHEVILAQGISLTNPYAAELNFSIATALSAAIIFVMRPNNHLLEEELRQLKIIANPYQYHYPKVILGVITNSDRSLELTFPNLRTSDNLDVVPLQKFLAAPAAQAVTPPIFKYHLIEKARRANKTIVLPEGDEPRTLVAANMCADLGIAQCVLLEDKNKIDAACQKLNLKLSEKIKIIEPQKVVDKYVAPLYELRRAKGLTLDEARKQLEDHVMLGTMMLHLGEVDGLVSGATHTTANTVRPALQIIKTPPEVKIVSSIFFMCLPDQVLVYGDCAVNPNPEPEELADIAIQSAASAAAFGIIPKVAMLSYSTDTSGVGPSVDRVRAATEIVKRLRPDLAVDGPIQYDAAISEETGRLKMPNSNVAGHATVFIVPCLDVGNIMYKAVQRGTGIVCIGPMLQGLRKPVNDLSRGCFADDIMFTIAVTAVQALGNKK